MNRAITFFSVAALAATAMAGGATALEKVRFGTNWVAEAEHGGFYQAAADGTYAACGLEVEIVPGGPQVNNRALMLAGKIDFHMGGNMLFAFSAVEQNIPLKIVASFFQKEPQVILTHPGQGLDTWESLTTIDLILGDNGYQSFYKWMIAEHGFTAEQRKPYTYNPAPFLANKRSGQQGYVTSEPFAIEQQGGFKPNIFLMADYGFNTYATTIETMQTTIDKRPQVIKCFVDGSALGWVTYLYGDATAANDLIRKHNPEMSMKQINFSIDKMKEYGIVDSGDTLTMGIGAMTDKRHKSFYDKMVKASVVKAGVDIDKSYTLQFVNNGVGVDEKKKLMGN
jgi:NitT/TauT family transport system substrate-binding protein